MKFIQISSMPVDENITLKRNFKLKVKLPQPKSQVENITIKKKLKLIKVKLPRARSQLDKSIEFEHERPISGSCKNGSSVKCTGKRGAETRLCGQKLKKLKIGSGAMQQCGALLRKLMNHQFGFLFNQSVKPAALQIPDYFDIISEPMDLGTVKKKLENGSYSSARDFAADVKLTFSNAMKYNPYSTNWVHELAGEFDRMFTLNGSLLKQNGVRRKNLIWSARIGSNGNIKQKIATEVARSSSNTRLLCENKDDGETASEIQIVTTSSCFNSNVIGKDSSLKHPKNNNTNPKCESATSKRLGNPAKTYPKEKARIDAHVKVAKEEVALKLLRQRQAARLALEECLLVMLLENHHSLNMKRTPMKFIQMSSMPIDENITLKKNLKFIQISSMPIDENITLKKNLKLKVKFYNRNLKLKTSQLKKKKLKLIKVKLPRARSQLDKSIEFEHERPISGSCKNGSLVKYTGKRGAETRLCGQKLKKLKIGSGVMQQCGALLRKLMNHEFGFLFNQPVKPASQQIPDYFDIISEPMDLGTVKKKLENGSYSSARDFAADVKLTFSNAMKYNPYSTNWVHELAGEFSRMFTLEWKSLEAKWSEEEKSDSVYKDQGLMEISKRKLPPKLHGHLRRLGLLCENKDDGETASEIQIFTSSCFKSNVIGKFCTQFYNYAMCMLIANTTGEKARIDAHVKAAKEESALKFFLRQRDKSILALEEAKMVNTLKSTDDFELALFLIHSHVNIKSSSTFHVVQITNKCLPSIFQLKYLEDLTFEGCLSIDDDGLETLERGRKSIKVVIILSKYNVNCEFVIACHIE
ncbi:hypothetical protein Scep_027299 [Stephania cephalantha]|uniref:Bromo domain-containing protein n=1 Tax=Stephania cephalantha TaxID=152367 RepID=A0AAP0ECB2_9MAGN